MDIRKIEAVRMGIQFQEAPSLFGSLHQSFHIHFVGFSFIDQPSARMGQDVEIRAIHGPEDPLGLFFF
jgi:hypothetical protein